MLGRSTGITADGAADAVMDMFHPEIEFEAASNGEERTACTTPRRRKPIQVRFQ